MHSLLPQHLPMSGGSTHISRGVFPLSNDQLLYRNIHRSRGGLILKADRRVYHSTLGVRVIKKRRRRCKTHVVSQVQIPGQALATSRRKPFKLFHCRSAAGTSYSRESMQGPTVGLALGAWDHPTPTPTPSSFFRCPPHPPPHLLQKSLSRQ